jgi:UDP:flavonoid glycosyltransferase YjiC (YdhE family)
MRALFVTSPGDGHVLPVVPLAWALRGAGSDVVVATGGNGVDAAARAGLVAVDIAAGADLAAVRGRHLAGMATLGQDERFLAAMRLFAELSGLMADGAVHLAQSWQPDLVVYTPLQAAGPIAAARCGASLVEHGFQLTGVLKTIGLLTPHLGPTLARHGLSAESLPAAQGLDVCPPGLRSYEPAGAELGYRPYNGGAVLPEVLLSRGSRQRICLTLGTSLPGDPNSQLLGGLLHAAGRLDLDVVLAMGAGAPVPEDADRVLAHGWLPLSAVLPSCDLVVHHGGAGTALTAAWTATRQLVLPQLADQHFNAGQIERAGVGTGADIAALTPASIEHLLVAGLATRDRVPAQEIAEQMRDMPSPADVADRLSAGLGATDRVGAA